MNRSNLGKLLSKAVSTSANSGTYPRGFTFWPNFLSASEQRALLSASLRKLDATESRLYRKRRKLFENSIELSSSHQSLMDLFYPDEYYDFHEGHYDGVIRYFREMHVSSWPENELETLSFILNRLRDLCPSDDIQTHLLHLASYGSIMPHIDNVSASGSWILGVSLGDERVLRMEGITEGSSSFDVNLPSGSVYIQRDEVRYNFKHSIVGKSISAQRDSRASQRVSMMIRDRLTR